MVINAFNRLRCPKCNRYYLNKDLVFLDELNTVIHQRCYTLSCLPIKDSGQYKNIIQRYDIFKELA